MTSGAKKLIPLSSLKRKLPYLRRGGKTIVFTNGCFDVLHRGHVSYLQSVKKNKNRILIIGLNSDSSVRRLKGPKRPINTQFDRAAVLAGLECVDFIVIFKQDTPYELIKAVKPDILVKGADWKRKKVAGSDIVAASGGKVEFIRYLKGYSTSKFIEKIQRCAK